MSKVRIVDIYFVSPPRGMPGGPPVIPFGGIFFDRVSDILLGILDHIGTCLVQAVLSSAAVRTRSCRRSLSLTLLKKNSKM